MELTIKWNKIDGVGDISAVGQLFPMIISIGGIGNILQKLIRKKKFTPDGSLTPGALLLPFLDSNKGFFSQEDIIALSLCGQESEL